MSTKTETAIVEVIIKGNAANASLKDMEKAAAALRAQLRKLPADSEEFARKSAEYQKVTGRIREINQELKGMSGLFARLGIDMRTFGGVLAGVIGGSLLTSAMTKIGGFFTGLIKSNNELSDSMADIQKTTGMTAVEVEKLNEALGQINTRTSRKELREIAIGAGQLGIAKKDVLAFTVAVDKMVVALGDEFSGGATEVTKIMGGLRNIFTDIRSDKIDQDMLHIGNAVNALGAAGMATGPVVTDFATRIGGVGISLGLTSGQVLGLSATLQELSVGTEKGGTAIVKILQRMTTHTEEFAKVANMDVKAFTELVNTDLFAAFNKVVEGAQKGGSSATALGKILDSLGVDGAGASEVMTKLGNNTSLLKEKVDLANTSLKGTSSIMEEFSTKNETAAAHTEKFLKNIAGWFTNSSLANGWKTMAKWLAEVTDGTKKASQATEEERRELLTTEAQILSYNVGNEKRTKLIRELQEKYPQYLQNIDAEKVGHEELSAAIALVNESLLDKIMIQQLDEDMADELAETAEAKIKSARAMVEMQKQLSYVFEENQRALRRGAKSDLKSELSGLPTEVQVEEILKFDTHTAAGVSRFNESLLRLRDAYGEWKDATLEANKASMVSNDLEAKKAEIMNALGMGMKKVNDQAKKIQERGGTTGAEIDKKLIDEHERLIAELEKMALDNSQAQMDEYAKKADDIHRFHVKELERINKDTLMSEAQKENARVILRKNTVNKIKALEKEMDDRLIQEKNNYLKERNQLLNSEERNEVDAINEKFDKLIIEAKKFNDDTVELEKERLRRIDEVRRKYAAERNKPTTLEDGTKGKTQEEQLRDDINNVMMYYNQLEQVGSMYYQNQRNKEAAARNEAEMRHQQELDRNKMLLEKKLISQEEYDKRISALELKKQNREALERQKDFARQKAASRYNTIINGAEAIGSIWAKWAANPVVATNLSLVSGAVTLAKLALIEAQQPPKYAGGGFHKPEGFATSETLFSSASGRPFIAGEAGTEYIVPSWMLSQPIVANQVAMMEAIRSSRSFASGGPTSASPAAAPAGGGGNNGSLIDAINRLNANLEGGIGVNYDLFTKGMESVENAKKLSRVG